MVRIRIVKTKYGTYGYLVQDKYSSELKRSKMQVLKKLTSKELEAYQRSELSIQDILKNTDLGREN